MHALPPATAAHPARPAFKAWADERLGPAFLWAAYRDCWLAARAACKRGVDPPRERGPEPANEETG